MGWRHTPSSYLLLLAAVVAGALAFHAWRRRQDAPGAKSLTAFLIAVCWWEAGYALEFGAGDLQAKIFWAKAEYLGIVMVPLFWLVFALQYTGRERWLTYRNFALLGAPLLVTLALVFTNEAHNLIWTRTALGSHDEFSLLEVDYGAWFWVHWVYSLLLVLLGTVLLVSSLPRSLRLYQKQSWALLIAASMPWLGNVIYVLGLGPVPNLDLTAFAFLLSGVAMSLGFSRFGLLNLIPVARNKVVEGMRDGVIVLDPHHRIVDLNPAASRILSLSTAEGTGSNIVQLVPGGIPLPGANHSAGEPTVRSRSVRDRRAATTT